MKNFYCWLICLVCAGLAVFCGIWACDSSASVSRYCLILPELPPAWDSLLGMPQWKIKWLNGEGVPETRIIRTGESAVVSLPNTQASAVLAYPFWPEKGINAEVFKPAGGLFPFDAAGDSLSLSWRGGVEAVLYGELARASLGEPGSKSSVPRLPRYFNWPRFRELFADESVNRQFRDDPWLADWPSIADKIWQSGFDKRRLVPLAREEISVPVPPGPWVGTSPFAAPLFFEAAPRFPVIVPAAGSGAQTPTDVWVSAQGILRCNFRTWVFYPY